MVVVVVVVVVVAAAVVVVVVVAAAAAVSVDKPSRSAKLAKNCPCTLEERRRGRT